MKAFTVALVGLDGVGKTTVARRLARTHPERFRYLYMGDNVASFSHALPTTRWWRSRKGNNRSGAGTRSGDRRGGIVRGWGRSIRKTIGFGNRMLDEAYRHRVANRFVRRGFIVLFDRHFMIDYHHGDEGDGPRSTSGKRRARRLLRRRILSPPDFLIVLDAPAEVAFRRKGEFDLAHLERRRSQYLALVSRFENTQVVDADRKLEEVVEDVKDAIDRFERGKGSGG